MNHLTQNYMVKLFKMLSNSNRLRVLHLLWHHKEPLYVGDIAEKLQLEQSTLSSHLTRLRENKVIRAEQRGLHMYYSIRDPNIGRMLTLLGAVPDESPARKHRPPHSSTPPLKTLATNQISR